MVTDSNDGILYNRGKLMGFPNRKGTSVLQTVVSSLRPVDSLPGYVSQWCHKSHKSQRTVCRGLHKDRPNLCNLKLQARFSPLHGFSVNPPFVYWFTCLTLQGGRGPGFHSSTRFSLCLVAISTVLFILQIWRMNAEAKSCCFHATSTYIHSVQYIHTYINK